MVDLGETALLGGYDPTRILGPGPSWFTRAVASARAGVFCLPRVPTAADVERWQMRTNRNAVLLGGELVEAGCLLLAPELMVQLQAEGCAYLRWTHLGRCEDGIVRPAGWNRHFDEERGLWVPYVPPAYPAIDFAGLLM
jgi:hypothetical protein